jgi:hypothetical protein
VRSATLSQLTIEIPHLRQSEVAVHLVGVEGCRRGAWLRLVACTPPTPMRKPWQSQPSE